MIKYRLSLYRSGKHPLVSRFHRPPVRGEEVVRLELLRDGTRGEGCVWFSII